MVRLGQLGQDVLVKLLNVAKDAGDMEQLGVVINDNSESFWMKPSSLLDLIESNHPDNVYTILTIR